MIFTRSSRTWLRTISKVAWPVRVDPWSSFRSGFEVRTYRRCRRILMFHHFPAEAGVGSDCLVSSTDFSYSDELQPADPHNPVYTFLASVTTVGYRRDGAGYVQRTMPPLEFEYSQPIVGEEIQTLDAVSVSNLPVGLDGAESQWVDLDGDGLAGALTPLDGGWGYKRNLSPLTTTIRPDGTTFTRARLGELESVASLPSYNEFGRAVQLLDLAGDGLPDAVSFDRSLPGFFERDARGGWESFQPFASLPNIDFADPNLRFVDLTGDGRADIVGFGDAGVWVALNQGNGTFGPPQLAVTNFGYSAGGWRVDARCDRSRLR